MGFPARALGVPVVPAGGQWGRGVQWEFQPGLQGGLEGSSESSSGGSSEGSDFCPCGTLRHPGRPAPARLGPVSGYGLRAHLFF